MKSVRTYGVFTLLFSLLVLPATAAVTWCNLQWPPSTTGAVGTPTELIFGQVYEAGVTDQPGPGPGLQAELGYGPDGSDPTSAAWTWIPATYNVDVGNNDEYMATITPTTVGTYDYAYRYALGDGVWTIGDLNGSQDGYTPEEAGDLQVTVPNEACCYPDGTCQDVPPFVCLQTGGIPQGPGTTCDTGLCRIYKWLQPPLFNDLPSPHPDCFWGWDEPSIYGGLQIAADDWACRSPEPVTDIHWWGSYQGWIGEQAPEVPIGPELFHLTIWTDVPAGVDLPYSHPGVAIWEFTVPRAALMERAEGCDYYPGMMEGPDTCFRYDIDLPEDAWFYQNPDQGENIYWLSIAAIYPQEPPMEYTWGWKTRPHFFNDAAIRIYTPSAPTLGMPFEQGEPIFADQDPWDLAFALTTLRPPPEFTWDKSIDGIEWAPGMVVTGELADTIQIVDTVASAHPFSLIETWDTNRLSLVDSMISPAGSGTLLPADGRLRWEVTDAPVTASLSKVFTILPSTWTHTDITEELEVGEMLDTRVVTISKRPPVLWIDSSYVPEVVAGQPAAFTLSYGNDGGYENAVMIRNEFPPEAPFLDASIPPDRQDATGAWVEWDLGDLAESDTGNIEVIVDVSFELQPSNTVSIIDFIVNHAGDRADAVTTRLHILDPNRLGDLGDAPDGMTNHFNAIMTAYPPGGGPLGIGARFPTVYREGAPPYGPIHWNPAGQAWLGANISAEYDADLAPDADPVINIDPPANLPDRDRFDDGVLFPLVLPHCQPSRFQFILNAAVPNTYYVNAWFDWNRDGDWDDVFECPDATPTPEWAVQNMPVTPAAPGPHIRTTPPFTPWHPGQDPTPIWMRITLSEIPWDPAGFQGGGGSGPAEGYATGETEDYYVETYEFVEPDLDFGDAPDGLIVMGPPYPTLLLHNGARHQLSSLHMGAFIDPEPNGQPDPNATGDDLDGGPDEDGVFFTTPFIRGQTGCVDILVAGGGGLLDGWIDYNQDGMWGPAERLWSPSLPVGPGMNPNLCFNVPAGAHLGPTFARFRLSSAGTPLPVGYEPDGEVEDYLVDLFQAPPTGPILITNITHQTTGEVSVVAWLAETGTVYQLQSTPDLVGAPPPSWIDVGVEVTGPANRQVDTNATEDVKGYRVIAPFVP